MKAPITSIRLAVLCFLMGLESVSAFMGFSFGNLMFSLNICRVPGPRCKTHCHGPLAPKDFCDHRCADNSSSSNSGRRLDDSTEINWSQAACESFDTSTEDYQQCIDGASADCQETSTDSDASYVDASNYSDETNSSNGSSPIASRMSFLPYIIAGTVASMFLILYVWRKKRKEQQLKNEDLLADDDSFHGSIARRVNRANVAPSAPSAVPETTTGYALA